MNSARFEPQLRSVLRIVVGFTFSLWGYMRLFGAFGKPKAVDSLLIVAGILELFGGNLILLGLFTRPTAFLLSGMMAIAYFKVHAPRTIWPITNGGELAVLYSFIFLWLSAAGAGPWSLDYFWSTRRASLRRFVADHSNSPGNTRPSDRLTAS